MRAFTEVALVVASLGFALAGAACARNYGRPAQTVLGFFRKSAVRRSIWARAGIEDSDPRIERAEVVVRIGFAAGFFLSSLVLMYVAVVRLT